MVEACRSVSRGFYILSWTNVICYVLWLTHVTLLNRIGGAFLVALVVAVPLVAAALSLVLVVWIRSVGQSERWMMLASNLLLLVLWTTSMIAPN